MDKRSKLSELDKRSELSKLDIRSKSSLNVVEASVIYRQQEKEKERGGVTYETKEVDEIKKVDEKRVTFEKKKNLHKKKKSSQMN